MINAVDMEFPGSHLVAESEHIVGPGVGLGRCGWVYGHRNVDLIAEIKSKEAWMTPNSLSDAAEEEFLGLNYLGATKDVALLCQRIYPGRHEKQAAHKSVQYRDLHIETGTVGAIQQRMQTVEHRLIDVVDTGLEERPETLDSDVIHAQRSDRLQVLGDGLLVPIQPAVPPMSARDIVDAEAHFRGSCRSRLRGREAEAP
jgi:hypothetical protein